MIKTRYAVLLLLLCVSLLAGCAKPADSVSEQVTVAMGFIKNVQFTPMYVALEKGYFAEVGLNVELDYGMETDLLQRLGAGDIPFAIASGDQVALARANGLPVRYVANWYRRFPVCVVSMASKGITEPADLQGKTVGTPVIQGASYIGWLAFAQEVGLDANAVDLQVIGYTQTASLVEDRVDAAICYALNEPVQLRASGEKISVFYLDKYTGLVSNGIITSDEMIKEKPELVSAMISAFIKGLEFTIAHADEAFEITRKVIPEMDDDNALLQRAVLDESISFWEAEHLGYSDPADWQETVDMMQGMGLIGEADVDAMFSNEYLP